MDALPKSINFTCHDRVNNIVLWDLISDTDLEIFVDDKVFIFDVAVSDSIGVEIMHHIDNLGEHVSSLFFGKAFVL
jgi:hypothetical protein